MRKATFFSAIILPLIIAIFLALPYFDGFLVRHKYQDMLLAITSPQVEAKITNYKQGWFSSDINLLVTLHISNDKTNIIPNQPIHLTIQEHIIHGPIIFNTSGAGKFDLLIAQALINSKLLQITPDVAKISQLSAVTTIDLPGNFNTNIQIPSLNMSQANNQLRINNLNSHFAVSRNIRNIKGLITVDQLNLTQGNQSQQIKNLVTKTDIHQNAQGMWLGNKALKVDSATMQLPGHQPFVFNNVNGSMNSNQSGSRINGDAQLDIQSVDINGKSFGPQQIAFRFANADATALSKMNEVTSALQTLNASNENFTNTYQLMLDLLSKGVELHLDKFNLTTQWGAITATGNVMMPEQQGVITNIFSLLQSMNLEAKIQIPSTLTSAFVEKLYGRQTTQAGEEQVKNAAKMYISNMINDGWLVPQGDTYVIGLNLQKGQFLVNGKPPKTMNIQLTAPTPMPGQQRTTPQAPTQISPVKPAATPSPSTSMKATTKTAINIIPTATSPTNLVKQQESTK